MPSGQASHSNQPLQERSIQNELSDKVRSVLEDLALFFHNQLVQHPAGKPALEYLHKRGLTDQTIQAFGLGYALDGWEGTIQYFSAKGVSVDLLAEAGLVTERDSGGYYDRFRNRITIPIRNANGQMTGFGARILDPNDVPKFINSPQTITFDKGKLLYGLDNARKSIRAMDQAVVVEGYLDVIMLHQAGYTNTISPMGTALTEDQLRMLKKYTRRVILALDADAAGQKATIRGLEIARQAMDHESEIGFDIHGLLRHEARLQADIRVTTIPEGMDPDEVVLRDPTEWQKILDTAKPLVIHVMETLAQEQDISDPKVKQSIAGQMIPLIEDVPNMVERDAYRQRLARLLRVDEELLGGRQSGAMKPSRSRWNRQTSGTDTASPSKKPAPLNNRTDPRGMIEDHVVSALLRQPDMLHRLDRMLQQSNLNRVSDVDIHQTDRLILFQLVGQSLTQSELNPEEYIAENRPEITAEVYSRLGQQDIQESIKPDALNDDLFRSVLRMRLMTINQTLNELRFLLEEAEDQEQNNQYQAEVLQLTQQIQRINQAMGSLTRIKI